MRAERVYKTEAIVLKRLDLGEADKIVTAYTPYLGKIRAVAKGVRRPTSKMGGHLEPFTHSRLLVAAGRNLDIITQAETIHSFRELREDLFRLSHACYLMELLDGFTEERLENRPLFELLLEVLGLLTTAKDLQLLMRYYEVKLLEHLGYRPQLRSCVSCGRALKPRVNVFSPALGGVLCVDCRLKDLSAPDLSLDGLKVLRFLQDNPYPGARRLRLGPAVQAEIQALLGGYLRYLLERDLKSTEFLRTLRRQGVTP
jgi:DNA repair protein RecO (recombination protein O)